MSELIPCCISIDPGLNTCGVAVFTYKDNRFQVKSTTLINNLRKLTDGEKLIAKKYTDRLAKLDTICKTIDTMYDTLKEEGYEINTLIVEAPFYSSFRPAAFGSLVETISLIRYNVAFKRNSSFYAIEPMAVKKAFAARGMANKDDMRETLLLKIQTQELDCNIDIATISEHEVDAIAIGYTHFLFQLKTL
jgi:Holliday junction resolvasome RuvABC endonuclease subunit